jgi:hypothetical protein
VSTPLRGGFDQSSARGDAAYQPFDLRPAFDLQTVWTVILKGADVKQIVRIADDFAESYHNGCSRLTNLHGFVLLKKKYPKEGWPKPEKKKKGRSGN